MIHDKIKVKEFDKTFTTYLCLGKESQKDEKESGKPDSCAGVRLCQQTLSLGAECASSGRFLLYRTQFPIK